LIGDLSGYPSRDLTRANRDLQTRPNSAMAFAHIEKHGETHIVALAEPQPPRQAADRLRFSDVDLLILRRTGDDSVSSLAEIGQPKCEILIAHTRAAEAAVDEQSLQSPLQVRPHPVRKIPARDDELVQRQRREVRGEEAVESDDACFVIHISKRKTGRSPATRNPSPARCNQQPPGPLSNHCSVGPAVASMAVGPVKSRVGYETEGKGSPRPLAVPAQAGLLGARRHRATGDSRRQYRDSNHLLRQVNLELLAIEIGDLIE
jgi:hypothetical protein